MASFEEIVYLHRNSYGRAYRISREAILGAALLFAILIPGVPEVAVPAAVNKWFPNGYTVRWS